MSPMQLEVFKQGMGSCKRGKKKQNPIKAFSGPNCLSIAESLYFWKFIWELHSFVYFLITYV